MASFQTSSPPGSWAPAPSLSTQSPSSPQYRSGNVDMGNLDIPPPGMAAVSNKDKWSPVSSTSGVTEPEDDSHHDQGTKTKDVHVNEASFFNLAPMEHELKALEDGEAAAADPHQDGYNVTMPLPPRMEAPVEDYSAHTYRGGRGGGGQRAADYLPAQSATAPSYHHPPHHQQQQHQQQQHYGQGGYDHYDRGQGNPYQQHGQGYHERAPRGDHRNYGPRGGMPAHQRGGYEPQGMPSRMPPPPPMAMGMPMGGMSMGMGMGRMDYGMPAMGMPPMTMPGMMQPPFGGYGYQQPAAFPMPAPTGNGKIYQVQFKGTVKYFILGAQAPPATAAGEFVVVEADRGEDIGIITEVLAMKTFIERRYVSKTAVDDEDSTIGRIIRSATVAERQSLADKYHDEQNVMQFARELAHHTYRLPLIIQDAEYQFDRHKLTIYYHADGRVDFRELVRDLFSAFKARIWMKKLNSQHPIRLDPNAAMALASGMTTGFMDQTAPTDTY